MTTPELEFDRLARLSGEYKEALAKASDFCLESGVVGNFDAKNHLTWEEVRREHKKAELLYAEADRIKFELYEPRTLKGGRHD
jgi:hypothetical protein